MMFLPFSVVFNTKPFGFALNPLRFFLFFYLLLFFPILFCCHVVPLFFFFFRFVYYFLFISLVFVSVLSPLG